MTGQTSVCANWGSLLHSPLWKLFDGLHHGSTTSPGLRLHFSDNRPRTDKGNDPYACSKMITAEETGQLLLENLYKQFGLPDKLISDWGPQFASMAFKELLKLLGVKSSLSTAYHPQTDGTTEWVNQEIEAYLAIYCALHPEEWLTGIHLLEFTHNN